MSELGELLELLVRPGERFHSVRGTLRHGGGPDGSETVTRFWLERPDRVRVERDGPGGRDVFVDDGEREWHYTPVSGATVHPSQRAVIHGFELLLDPVPLAGLLVLDPAGRTVRGGREGIRARARARWAGSGSELFPWPAEDADAYDLVVDAERGVVLRLASLLDGEPREVSELTEIAFDEELPPDTFVFSPPPGEQVRELSPGLPRAEELTLAEAAGRAPFVLLVPRRSPEGAELSVFLAPGDERAGEPAGVGLRYRFPSGLHYLSIGQGSRPELDLGDAMRIERDGVELRARDLGGQRQVTLERAGTHVLLVSDLPLELLAEIAASLEPWAPEA